MLLRILTVPVSNVAGKILIKFFLKSWINQKNLASYSKIQKGKVYVIILSKFIFFNIKILIVLFVQFFAFIFKKNKEVFRRLTSHWENLSQGPGIKVRFFERPVLKGDETWIFTLDPDTMHWKTPSSPTVKKARMSRAKLKAMPVDFFDIHGVDVD